MRKFVRTERGERIDQPDFQHAAETSTREQQDDLIDGLLIGRDNSDANAQARGYVLKGWTLAGDNGTKILTITKGDGAAILPYRDKGEVKYSTIVVGGDSSKLLDLSTYASATYKVWIRAEFRDSDFQNRMFWDAVAATPTEYPRSIATRRSEGWQAVVEVTSPGAEWIEIGTVVQSTMVVTDTRELFFEGKASNSFAVVDAEWGGGDDRSNTGRDTKGVFGLRRFVRSVQRQLQDIIGDKWWSAIPKSIPQLISEKLARDGSQTMQGVLIPDGDETRDLGNSTGNRWRDLWCRGANFSASIAPSTTLTKDIGSTTLRWRDLFIRDASLTGALTAVGNVSCDDLSCSDITCATVACGELAVSSRVKAHLIPDGTMSLTLGQSGGPRWAAVHAVDVQAFGNYSWATARSFTKSIPGTAGKIPPGHEEFYSGLLGSTSNPEGTSERFSKVDNAGTSAPTRATWALELPNGAVVTGVTLHVAYAVNAGTELRAAVIRVANTDGSAQSFKSGTAYDVIPATGSVTTVALTLDETTGTRTIVNEDYAYYVWIGSTTAESGYVLLSIQVDYEMTVLALP